MDQFPPNSARAKAHDEREPKVVERVTSGDAVRRKPSLGKQFKQTFFSGDGRTTFHYVIASVILPAIQDMIIEAGQSGIERLVRGETRLTGRGSSMNQPSPYGNVKFNAYNRMSPSPQRQVPGHPVGPQMSRRARATHSFGEIVIPDRREAEEVIERMFDIVSKFEEVTVADLYELVGLESTHQDNKWGWTDMRGATVRRNARSGGYLLDLPEPEPLG